MNFDGYDVLWHDVVISNGSYRKDRYWLRGWITDPLPGHVEYTHGYTGRETVVTIERITPIVVFDVVAHRHEN